MEKQKWLNINVLYWVIIALLVLIAIMWFFLGRMSGGQTNVNGGNNAWQNIKYEDVSIKIIKDNRDPNLSNMNLMLDSFKELPSLSNVEVTTLDFADEWIREYLEENEITMLPAFIFSTKNFNVSQDPVRQDVSWWTSPKINEYLYELPGWEYLLPVDISTFNPFVERSERGFKLLTEEQYNSIMEDEVYIDWPKDAKVTWLEYSDSQCSFCAKLHKEWTHKSIKESYPNDVNIIFQNFPIFSPEAAEVLECLWAEVWEEAFYSLVDTIFQEWKSATQDLIAESVKLWANEASMKTCIEEGTYEAKVSRQMDRGRSLFNISWTPWNIIINNETLEYEEVSGAQPFANFDNVVKRLLAE